MIRRHLLLLAASLLCLGALRADDTTVTGTVGCAKCNYKDSTGAKSCAPAVKVGEKVYLLTGKTAPEYKKGGEYELKGSVAKDGKSFTVTEMKKKY